MLPLGWGDAGMSEIVEAKLGKMLDQVKNKGEPRRYLRNINVRWGVFDLSDLGEMRVTEQEEAQLSVSNGDIFVCEGGEPGRAAVWRNGENNLVFQKALHRLRPRDQIEPDFISIYLAHSARNGLFNHLLTGTTIKHLPQDALLRMRVPLPPHAEQRRIVAKLDALTARIARARTELERVCRLSKSFRERAIVAAFDGSLTARWRESRPGWTAESDAALEERFRSATKSARRKPPAQIDWKPATQLPSVWRWVSVDKITAVADYGTSAKTSDKGGTTPVLRMGNLQNGEIDWINLKFLPDHHPDLSGLLLEEGDVLFNRTNSFELVGKTAIFRGHDRPASFASYLIRLRPCGMQPALLAHYLNSPFARRWVEAVASQQVGQANVNGSKLKALGIPLPSPDEQVEMLRLLDAAFARANRLEAEAARARALLNRLESAILAKAFRGELVPQDPADEPAFVLLERIRAERTAPAPKRKRAPRALAS